MTHEHIKALNKLIAAVERGDPNKNDGTLYLLFGDDWVHAWDVIGRGSLDAANALHEALLGYGWGIASFNMNGAVSVMRKRPLDVQYGFADMNPARAWLIAILKAYRAQMDA